MKGYKGFDKDFKCRDKQYSENTTFEKKDAEICERGMQFCEAPFSVFEYYPPCDANGNLNRFAEVEALDETKTDDNEKYCTKKLHIGAELSLGDFIKAGVKFILDRVKSSDDNTGDWSASTNTGNWSASTNTGDWSASTNTGDRSASTNTGYCSASTNTGNRSASTNTGDCSASTNTGNRSASTNTGNWSASTNTGDRSASTNTGYCSASTNTGNRSASTNTGDCSASTNTGNWSASTNTGDCSASTNTGYCSASKVEGKESVAMAIGYQSKAAGALGCWIVLAEWDSERKHIIRVKSHKVDGKVIKADTFYKLENNKFVEADKEES